ncbi:MAG: hypothetical protein QXV69_10155 [Sulfolobaceae archaeon]
MYIFYLVAKYLESKNYKIEKRGSEYVAIRGDKRLKLMFNAPLPRSFLKKVDEKDNVEKYKGRPDISLFQDRGRTFIGFHDIRYQSSPSFPLSGSPRLG